MISGGIETLRIFVNKTAVKLIANLMKSGRYIPDDITLNIPDGDPDGESEFKYDEKRHRYHAYLAFSKSQQTSHYDQLINEVISEIKQYEKNGASDIKSFVNLLKSKNRYSRIIKLLIPFLSLDKDFKKDAIESIVNVVSKKDSDIPEPKRISEFCSDSSLCKDAANELITLSASSAKKSDYKTSVLFDTFASEYHSSDNQFNNTRCIHILEELSERADANEIKQLLKKANDLKLTDAQIDSLKVRITEIADAADPELAIKICRLFITEKAFDLIYIKQAEKLVADGSDFVVVVCEVTDDLGHVRRLAKENIRFTVEGEGDIIGDASINANPRAVEWGSAPVLIRSTKKAGKIRIKAEVQFPGVHAPTPAELEIESIPYDMPMCYDISEKANSHHPSSITHHPSSALSDAEKTKLLQEVEAQQADFGIQK